ncbi:LacI family DNA-binding transcriptional regulator [Roseicyclus sp.]|uniref:LacI family DNA-binding transcriptional regulator n=1 Tax=Roseicyclus sp. TaxID=1914329 RepID=UPI003FA0321F
MGRATIPDIARRAGVSTATVDRVLNGRKGVSAANRQRVMEAAGQLGYLPLEGQVVLPARRVQLEFFIPRRLQAFLTEVARHIEDFASTLPLVSSIRVHDLPDLAPRTLVEALGDLSLETKGVGFVAVDDPLTRHAVHELTDAGVKVVTLASDLQSTPRAAYVGVNDRIAGRTAGLLLGRFLARTEGRIALFAGNGELYGQRERAFGARAVLEAEHPHLKVMDPIDVRSDNQRSEAAALALFDRYPDVVGLYCMGGGRTGIARVVSTLPRDGRPVVIMHDLSDSVRRFLLDGVIDVVIDQNAQLVAEQAVVRLLGAIAVGTRFLPEHFIEPRLILRENIPIG